MMKYTTLEDNTVDDTYTKDGKVVYDDITYIDSNNNEYNRLKTSIDIQCTTYESKYGILYNMMNDKIDIHKKYISHIQQLIDDIHVLHDSIHTTLSSFNNIVHIDNDDDVDDETRSTIDGMYSDIDRYNIEVRDNDASYIDDMDSMNIYIQQLEDEYSDIRNDIRTYDTIINQYHTSVRTYGKKYTDRKMKV